MYHQNSLTRDEAGLYPSVAALSAFPASALPSALGRRSGLLASGLLFFASSALFFFVLALTDWLAHPIMALAALSAAATLAFVGGVVSLRAIADRTSPARSVPAEAEAAINALPFPAVLTNADMNLLVVNQAGRVQLGLPVGDKADIDGVLSDDILAAFQHARLSVALRDSNDLPPPVEIAGQFLKCHSRAGDRFVWQVGPVTAESDIPIDANLPVLAIKSDGTIAKANARAVSFLGSGPERVSEVFPDGLPGAGEVASIRAQDAVVPVMIVDRPVDQNTKNVVLVPLGRPSMVDQAASDWAHFENLPVPLLWLDAEGQVRRANRNAQSLIGSQCRPGARLGDLTEGLGRPIADWLDETLQGHKTNTPEFLRVTNASAEIFVQVTLKPVTQGDETGLLAVLSDATELKTLEAQFVQSQKMQAIGQLAGGVAHDFNNLLTAISGHCDLLLLRHDQGDPDFADLMQINQNANRAAALVGQLLAFSRKQTLRPVQVDLRETVSDLTHLLNRLVGEKITLSFSHDPVLQSIRADKRQLEQVLMNLVVNARDAIPGNGEIRIVTEGVKYTEPNLRDQVTIPPGDYVSVKVIDTGIGIPPERLSKVFEPFYTTKRIGEGTGLGLSTAYGIVKQSGGYIFADSTLGQGTCFTLLFRAYKDENTVMQDDNETAKSAARHSDGVVLLVEDEPPVRAFASRALRLRGYTVLEAESGEEALALLEDPETKVDIFVSDVVMPGMDGPTWVRKALETRPDVRVIFVSGYAEESFGDEQSRIPNSVFLPKPFSLSELTETVQGLAAD